MITVTRLNGTQVTINALLIETIEETPDTIITLTTGKKIIALEKVTTVVNLVKKYMSGVGSISLSLQSQDAGGS